MINSYNSSVIMPLQISLGALEISHSSDLPPRVLTFDCVIVGSLMQRMDTLS